jgi:hypothetical protein
MVVLAESKPLTPRQKAALRLLIVQERKKARIEAELRTADREEQKKKGDSGGAEDERRDAKAADREEECDEKEPQQSAEEKRRAREANIREIKEEILALEARLDELQGEKHQLFLQLKKVLHEDEKKRQDHTDRCLCVCMSHMV